MQLLLKLASLTAIQALLYSTRKYRSADNQTILKKKNHLKLEFGTPTNEKEKEKRKEDLFLYTHCADVYSYLLLSHQCIWTLITTAPSVNEYFYCSSLWNFNKERWVDSHPQH